LSYDLRMNLFLVTPEAQRHNVYYDARCL
jgi:hypothetical protein